MGDRSESLGLPHRTASKPQLPSHPLPGNSVSPSHVKMVGLIPPSRAEMVGPHESGRARPLVNWLPRRAICCALSHRRSSVVSRASPGIITTDTVATATDAARPQLLPPPPPPLPLHLLRTPARHPTPTPVYGSGGKSNDACAPSSRERMGRKSTAVARGFRPPNTQSGHVHSGGAAEDRKATPYPPTIAPPFSAMDEGHAALQRATAFPHAPDVPPSPLPRRDLFQERCWSRCRPFAPPSRVGGRASRARGGGTLRGPPRRHRWPSRLGATVPRGAVGHCAAPPLGTAPLHPAAAGWCREDLLVRPRVACNAAQVAETSRDAEGHAGTARWISPRIEKGTAAVAGGNWRHHGCRTGYRD